MIQRQYKYGLSKIYVLPLKNKKIKSIQKTKWTWIKYVQCILIILSEYAYMEQICKYNVFLYIYTVNKIAIIKI